MARRSILFGLTVGIALMAIHAHAETQPLAYLRAAQNQPAKVELRVDGSLVVRITCDGPRRIIFDFPTDDYYRSLVPAERRKPLEFGFDQASNYLLPTVDTPHHRIGRLELKPRARRELERSQSGSFWGPSEMGEPWPVLNLDALRRLVRACSSPR